MSVATVLGPIGELAAHARLYAEMGLEVFPLKADKTPLTAHAFYDASTELEQINRWWEATPGALIGHRIGLSYLVLDVDPRHGGLETWRALKAEMGELPLTRGHASGRGDGGGHIWWLRPAEKLTTRKLTDWARERGVGAVLPGGSWTSGIDFLHHDLRYTILPPSPHPASGKPYYWLPGKGLEVEPAAMPAFLADLLVDEEPPPPPKAQGPRDANSIADWYSSSTDWNALLRPLGWAVVAGDGNSDGSRWRHTSATTAHSATIRHHCLFVYSTSTVFEVTEPGRVHGYTPFKAFALLRHGSNESDAARAAREQKDGPIRLDSRSLEHLLVQQGPLLVPSPGADGPPAPGDAALGASPEPLGRPSYLLPEEVWDSRPLLAHVRQAAQARVVSPDAVLAALLARVAAIAPWQAELPAIVGSAIGLTFYSALVGPPSAGKSVAARIARELLPAPSDVLDGLPIPSGEGMAEILYETEKTDKGKVVRVLKHHAAIFYIDEGQAVSELASRTGSTLMTTLRSAWSNGDLGASNASLERRRKVPGHQYVYGIVLGIQPAMAGGLLGDAAGGTPQRFLWLSAVDPTLPEAFPEWPGPVDWERPGPTDLDGFWTIREGNRRIVLDVAPEIAAEVRRERLADARGREVIPGDEHRVLLRLKTAALLAIFDKRLEVSLDDWHLAGLIVTTSSRVRNAIAATLSDEVVRADHAMGVRQARRELTVDGVRERKALDSAARSVARRVIAHAEAGEHGDEPGCLLRCLTRAIAGKYRVLVSTDAIVTEAVVNRWVEKVGERFRPGPSRPA